MAKNDQGFITFGCLVLHWGPLEFCWVEVFFWFKFACDGKAKMESSLAGQQVIRCTKACRLKMKVTKSASTSILCWWRKSIFVRRTSRGWILVWGFVTRATPKLLGSLCQLNINRSSIYTCRQRFLRTWDFHTHSKWSHPRVVNNYVRPRIW